MRNYIQPGKVITCTAPTGGVTSGQMVLIGAALFGIACGDAAEGESFELQVEGVFEVEKTSALAISVGDRLFYDATNGVVNKTAEDQLEVGVAVSAAANPSDTVRMRLGAAGPVLNAV